MNESVRGELSEQLRLDRHRYDSAVACIRCGELHFVQVRDDEALVDCGQAIEIMEILRSELADHFTPELRFNLATNYCSAGTISDQAGNTECAVDCIGQALNIRNELHRQFGDRMPDLLKQGLQFSYEKYKALAGE
jgi:hypothetical protein